MRHLTASLLVITFFAAPWIALNYPAQVHYITDAFAEGVGQLAAVITHNPRTVDFLQKKYTAGNLLGAGKIHIMIVPGHEPDYGGTEFGDIKERNLTVELADDLSALLKGSGMYEVSVSRDTHAWSPEFAAYFANNRDAILDWVKTYKKEMSRLVSVGKVAEPVSSVYHNTAPADVALRLYGMTKWANENGVDITIHIHLNDAPDRRAGVAGDHAGFAIYVPSEQYLNSTTTHAIADTVFKRLAKYNPVSNLKGETAGIIDEPELIAVGADNTSDAASMLIEYGYIYEPQFINPEVRSQALKDLAYQTYLGLQDFFDPSSSARIARPYDTLVLPHAWGTPMTEKSAQAGDVFALQTAFLLDGVYPPPDMSSSDCPRTGKIGACTRAAIEAYQKKHGITGEKGIVGSQTLKTLNATYGMTSI